MKPDLTESRFRLPNGHILVLPAIYEKGFKCSKCKKKERYSYGGKCQKCVLKK